MSLEPLPAPCSPISSQPSFSSSFSAGRVIASLVVCFSVCPSLCQSVCPMIKDGLGDLPPPQGGHAPSPLALTTKQQHCENPRVKRKSQFPECKIRLWLGQTDLFLLIEGSKMAFKRCVFLRCIQCHLVDVTLNTQKTNTTLEDNILKPRSSIKMTRSEHGAIYFFAHSIRCLDREEISFSFRSFDRPLSLLSPRFSLWHVI